MLSIFKHEDILLKQLQTKNYPYKTNTPNYLHAITGHLEKQSL
jgi:hypothetical protein|tara:strand:+ start:420 stop:548 length:129 start_codon:yes stop_codon:yes gene_type:complete